MKYLNLILLILSLQAQSKELVSSAIGVDSYIAKCRIPESSFTSEVFRFYSPSVNSFVLIGENGGSEKIPSNFRINTWITYTASFIYDEQNVLVTFSNYESPSVGTMRFPDGQAKFLACQLNGIK